MAEHIDESEVLQRALDTYGSLPQIVMIFEEMSELQKELCKYLRGKYSPENIAEEIADVEIMLEQMMMLFCCADDVRDWRRRKVARLKKHSVTYKRRDYLFAVRRRRVDDLQRWVLCLRSPRTHEWLPILGERPFVGHAEAEARLARLAKDNKWEVAYAYGIEFAPPENK